MATEFKHKSDPSIKISQLKADLRLMAELGQIDLETVESIINWLHLDYREKEWNKPPVADQMFRDILALMEEYDMHLYLPGGQEMSIYWNNWGDCLNIHETPSLFDVKYVKTLKKQYNEKKALMREASRRKLDMNIKEAIQKRDFIERMRFPGRITSGDERLETLISDEYHFISQCKDEKEKVKHQELAEYLEELICLRKRQQTRDTLKQAMDSKKVAPFILLEFSQWLAKKYPIMKITLEMVRTNVKEFASILPDMKALLFDDIRYFLEDHGWEVR